MGKVQSEYDVEVKFIERLESIGYEYIELKNYDVFSLTSKNKSLDLIVIN